MSNHTLAINPTTEGTGTHESCAAIFRDGELVFGVEEERFTRQKHGFRTFPEQSIRACLDFCEIDLQDVNNVVVSWVPAEMATHNLKLTTKWPTVPRMVYHALEAVKNYQTGRSTIENKLADIGTPVPPIETRNHHRCHAASAFYPSGFEEALVLTLDGRGETESTVIWRGDKQGLERIRTYPYPNSLGAFYGVITVYLGYRENNGEGKVMGLAPYGSPNREIERKFRQVIETGVDYDVTALNHAGEQALQNLESLFDRPRKSDRGEFSEWEKDFAYVAQKLLEETLVDIVETYCRRENLNQVSLAGGVALNCKMNKQIMELDVVDEIFIQPVANDAGTAIGAGLLETAPQQTEKMHTVYWGPEYTTEEIEQTLRECKLDYTIPEHLERQVAERLADGELIGWYRGRLEMGPRALGNRSILADPRTVESRDRVNRFVKHREEWRPFAPSLLEEAADEYLANAEPAPYMIKTFEVKEGKEKEIPAVLHPGDDTTRPQTVREDQNPRYYELLREFERITGVPVLLNTSFNDHGEPIINTPSEAIKDFFGMGLDTLVLGEFVIEKSQAVESGAAQVSELQTESEL